MSISWYETTRDEIQLFAIEIDRREHSRSLGARKLPHVSLLV
jgi:hypothetical protein